jgi:hypothetical protein
MIFNIKLGTFGGPLRLGDLLGVANVVEHFRQVENDPGIKFYLDPGSISNTKYVLEFYDWLMYNTNYFTVNRGNEYLPWERVNIWDYRDISGDLIHIENNQDRQKKIVVNPLFDAPYNTYRNWPISVFNEIINQHNEYSDYEKIIISNTEIKSPGWRCVTDMTDVILEIMTCEKYIGGSTGLSLFVSALNNPPENVHVMSSRCLLHTLPFRWQTDPRCTIKTYWLDFENTKW